MATAERGRTRTGSCTRAGSRPAAVHRLLAEVGECVGQSRAARASANEGERCITSHRITGDGNEMGTRQRGEEAKTHVRSDREGTECARQVAPREVNRAQIECERMQPVLDGHRVAGAGAGPGPGAEAGRHRRNRFALDGSPRGEGSASEREACERGQLHGRRVGWDRSACVQLEKQVEEISEQRPILRELQANVRTQVQQTYTYEYLIRWQAGWQAEVKQSKCE